MRATHSSTCPVPSPRTQALGSHGVLHPPGCAQVCALNGSAQANPPGRRQPHLLRNQSGILKVRGLLTITISCSSSCADSSPALQRTSVPHVRQPPGAQASSRLRLLAADPGAATCHDSTLSGTGASPISRGRILQRSGLRASPAGSDQHFSACAQHATCVSCAPLRPTHGAALCGGSSWRRPHRGCRWLPPRSAAAGCPP